MGSYVCGRWYRLQQSTPLLHTFRCSLSPGMEWNTKESTHEQCSQKSLRFLLLFFWKAASINGKKCERNERKKTALVRQLGKKMFGWAREQRQQQKKKKTRTDWKINTGRQCLWLCMFFMLPLSFEHFFFACISIFFLHAFFSAHPFVVRWDKKLCCI